MVHDINGSTRQVLTFPAVNPCESIAPATLLDSLTSLARDITSLNPNLLSTNRRNAREIVREVEIILVVLEEVRSDPVGPPVSAVLGLSELHVTFQKIRFLLEVCARVGARFWMLVNSGRAANQFRFFARSISTALDVLPLASIGVSGEAREAIELVIKQSRRARFDLEPADRRALDDVTEILNRFENRVEPDMAGLMRVLDFAGIMSRSDCDNEVRFLDSEIGLNWSNHEHKKTELELLSSLMGFVTYCRCLMFNVAGGESNGGGIAGGNSDSGFLNCLNSDDFRCPISLDLMIDPVTVSTGHTYDRSSILKWFGAGNPICPKTGERLKNTDLVPNLSLRRLIQQYCSQNNIPYPNPEPGRRNHDVTRTVLAGSSAAEGAIKMAAKLIASRLKSGTEEDRNRAAHEVRVMAKASIFNRSCLVDSGTITYLLELLASRSSSAQENAMAALLNLSKHQKSRAVVVNNGGLGPIVYVLQHGFKIETRHHAAATIFYLASIKEYSRSIGEIPEAIHGLLALIKGSSDRGKKNSLVALFGLLSHPHNHFKILASGAVPLLINLLTLDREDLVTDCIAILARLAEKPDGSVSILRHGAVDRILEVLSSSSSKAAKEHCVSLLLGVCVNNGGGDVIGVLAKSSILMGSLYSMLSDGTSRGSRKARDLIRVLHGYFERRSVGEIGRALPYEEQAVHVW